MDIAETDTDVAVLKTLSVSYNWFHGRQDKMEQPDRLRLGCKIQTLDKESGAFLDLW